MVYKILCFCSFLWVCVGFHSRYCVGNVRINFDAYQNGISLFCTQLCVMILLYFKRFLLFDFLWYIRRHRGSVWLFQKLIHWFLMFIFLKNFLFLYLTLRNFFFSLYPSQRKKESDFFVFWIGRCSRQSFLWNTWLSFLIFL